MSASSAKLSAGARQGIRPPSGEPAGGAGRPAWCGAPLPGASRRPHGSKKRPAPHPPRGFCPSGPRAEKRPSPCPHRSVRLFPAIFFALFPAFPAAFRVDAGRQTCYNTTWPVRKPANKRSYPGAQGPRHSKDSRPLVNLSARNGLTAGFSSGAHLNFPLLSCIEILHFSKCLAGRCLKIKYAAVSKRS